jgi:outer membrane protein OmpA-like peptidoglycan-associated protein
MQPVPVAAPIPLAPVPRRSGLPLLLIFLGILALVAVFVIGGVVYVGYQVKEKVTSVAHAVIHPAPSSGVPTDDAHGQQAPSPGGQDASALLSNLGNLLGGGSEDGDPVETISKNDPTPPCAAAPYPAQKGAVVPFQAGTVITTAWGIANGDIEIHNSVRSTDTSAVEMQGDSGEYKNDNGDTERPQTYQEILCNQDLAAAGTYITTGGDKLPPIIHGLTRFRLSTRTFGEIKSSGKSSLRYFYTRDQGEASQPAYVAGSLTRVEPGDLPYPLIVNDQRVNLPVIHLAGIFDVEGKNPFPPKLRPLHSQADMYVVDDPLDPLVLLWKVKDPNFHDGKFRIEVTKIDYPVPHPVNLVEKQLTEQKRAVTYGIYFDFNKDTIKPESEPVLKEIVQAMTDNPDWKLTVEGHTDNIGGDTYNLDLSKRRAAAVKDALVTHYHIAADRLSTNGYGSSRPVETNDTLEGRARNRRVELTRE